MSCDVVTEAMMAKSDSYFINLCSNCEKFYEPPIFTCSFEHSICFTCIFKYNQCKICKTNKFQENGTYLNGVRYDPEEIATCPTCSWESTMKAIIDHQTYCSYNQFIHCPLEDPFCTYHKKFDGPDALCHLLENHCYLLPEQIPAIVANCLSEFQQPTVLPDLMPEPEENENDGLKLVTDCSEVLLYCSTLINIGYHRFNTLMLFNKTGFLLCCQRYERCGSVSYRIAAIHIGPSLENQDYIFKVTFNCSCYSKESLIQPISVLENMHKVSPLAATNELPKVMTIDTFKFRMPELFYVHFQILCKIKNGRRARRNSPVVKNFHKEVHRLLRYLPGSPVLDDEHERMQRAI